MHIQHVLEDEIGPMATISVLTSLRRLFTWADSKHCPFSHLEINDALQPQRCATHCGVSFRCLRSILKSAPLTVAPGLSTIGNLRWVVDVSLGVFIGSIPIGGFVPFGGFADPDSQNSVLSQNGQPWIFSLCI